MTLTRLEDSRGPNLAGNAGGGDARHCTELRLRQPPGGGLRFVLVSGTENRLLKLD